ncbi:MAG: MgtC/SapB family protein [Acidimicrobiia bacterium]
MEDLSFGDMAVRLLLATVLTGLIGFEREATGKAAGLRTHAMVGFGAALFTIVSIAGFNEGDPARVAAQIVTGIGFLGAGAIWRSEDRVRGLTTAAGLWAVAAIGMGIGSGLLLIGTVGTLITLVVLLGLRRVDMVIARRIAITPDQIAVTIDSVTRIKQVIKLVERIDDSVDEISFERNPDGTGVLVIAVEPDRAKMISEMIQSMKGVAEVEIISPLYWKQRHQQ